MNEFILKQTETEKDILLSYIRFQLDKELKENKEVILYLYYYSGVLLQKLQHDENITEQSFARYEHYILNDISQIEDRESASPQQLFNFIKDIYSIETETRSGNSKLFLNSICRIFQYKTLAGGKYEYRKSISRTTKDRKKY